MRAENLLQEREVKLKLSLKGFHESTQAVKGALQKTTTRIYSHAFLRTRASEVRANHDKHLIRLLRTEALSTAMLHPFRTHAGASSRRVNARASLNIWCRPKAVSARACGPPRTCW